MHDPRERAGMQAGGGERIACGLKQRGGSVHVKAGEIFQADLQLCHRKEEIRSNEEREVVAVEKGGRGDHRGKRSSSSSGCKMMNISMDKGACDVGESHVVASCGEYLLM